MNKKRVVIKVSGEVFETGNMESNLDFNKIKELASSLKELVKKGYQVGVVVGAGNIFRARMVKGMEIDRVGADHMGMIATFINALALKGVLDSLDQDARVLSAFPMSSGVISKILLIIFALVALASFSISDLFTLRTHMIFSFARKFCALSSTPF